MELCAEISGSFGEALDCGSKGLLVRDSPPAETLCCVFEQDTIRCLVLVQRRKARKCPHMTETLLSVWDGKH